MLLKEFKYIKFNQDYLKVEIIGNRLCNYNCFYCTEKGKTLEDTVTNTDILNYLDRLYNKHKKRIHVYVLGGELSLFSKYTELCIELNFKEYIDFIGYYTNFSAKYTMYRSLLLIEKLHLLVTLHPSQASVTTFINTFNNTILGSAKNKSKISIFIMHDIDKIKEIKKATILLKALNIAYLITPISPSPAEPSIISSEVNKNLPNVSTYDYELIYEDNYIEVCRYCDLIFKYIVFKGMACDSGKYLLIIDCDRKVYQCYYDNGLGINSRDIDDDLFELSPIICNSPCNYFCLCDYFFPKYKV